MGAPIDRDAWLFTVDAETPSGSMVVGAPAEIASGGPARDAALATGPSLF